MSNNNEFKLIEIMKKLNELPDKEERVIYDVLSEAEIKKFVSSVKEKFGVSLPEDYLEFVKQFNSYWWYGCEGICGFSTDEENNYMNLIECTNWFLEILVDEQKEGICNLAVIASFYDGNGYILYLEQVKSYVLIEDIFLDFTLDGKDTGLLKFKNIAEVFIYLDYNIGDKIYEKEYIELFPEKVAKEQEIENRRVERYQKIIDDLNNDVVSDKAIKIDVIIDDEYLKYLKAEDKNNLWGAAIGDYTSRKNFRIYISKVDKSLGIAVDKEIKTHDKYGFCGEKPPVITSVLEKENYFVINTDRSFIEPVIIIKKYLNVNVTNFLKEMAK